MAELGREAKINAAFALGQITVGGGLVVGTGQGQAIIGQAEITGVEEVGTFVIVGDQGDDVGLAVSHLGHQGSGFAIAIFHIAGHEVGEETVVVVLAL